MLGITFGAYHSYTDWALIPGRIEIETPQIKENKIDIEGADGALDLTDFFGEVKYEDFPLSFPFSMLGEDAGYIARHTQIKNAIHGKKLKIILDDDPGFFYLGRLSVGSLKKEKGYATMTIDAECEPYKYKAEKTTVTQAITGAGVVRLTNGRKYAVPEITATAAFTLAYGGNTWAIQAGSYTLPELELKEGENTINVTGTGTITFSYQEGGL